MHCIEHCNFVVSTHGGFAEGCIHERRESCVYGGVQMQKIWLLVCIVSRDSAVESASSDNICALRYHAVSRGRICLRSTAIDVSGVVGTITYVGNARVVETSIYLPQFCYLVSVGLVT